MNKSTRYSPEVRERAVRMVFEHQGEHESQWAVILGGYPTSLPGGRHPTTLNDLGLLQRGGIVRGSESSLTMGECLKSTQTALKFRTNGVKLK